MAYNFPNSPSVGQEYTPTAGLTYVWNGYAWIPKAIAIPGGGSVSAPQGRPTLQTGVPVMTTTQSAKTTLYYTPFRGNQVPIYDGTSFTMTTFAELSQATTDTTKSPAAVAANSVYDLFVWNDSGTLRCTRGPPWTNDTTRSAGTALVKANGFDLNNASIINGPAAQRGTYVGTVRSNASSQLDWIYGVPGTTSAIVPGFFGVYSAYNRVPVVSMTGENTANWTYAAGTFRPTNNRTENRHSAIFGLSDDPVQIIVQGSGFDSGGFASVAVGVDATNSPSGTWATSAAAAATALLGHYEGNLLGFHFFQGLEAAVTATATFYGNPSANHTRQGIHFSAMM